MKKTTRTRNLIIFTALGAATGALTVLSRYVHKEIVRRGYPSWRECQCAFKTRQTLFPVLYSRHKRRGETVFSQEWGMTLVRPPYWLRRLLHHSAQIAATLNPSGRYVERSVLNPQEARQFALLLQITSASEEDFAEEEALEHMRTVWRCEVLHVPLHLVDVHIRRLYPIRVSRDRDDLVKSLPVLWDHYHKLPLPGERVLLETPDGTRIDYIGWTPSQISYCTARSMRRSGISIQD